MNLGDKTVRVNFRCSDSMYQYMELQAYLRSCTVSDFLRSLVDQYRRAEELVNLLDSDINGSDIIDGDTETT